MASCAPAIGAGPSSGRPADQNLTVSDMYIISGTESWLNVRVQSTGTLLVQPGGVLNTRSIILDGGSFTVNGGTVTVVQPDAGSDAAIKGKCQLFNLTNGAMITLAAPNAGTTIDTSQGGEAFVHVDASGSIIVTGGSRIQCTGGSGFGPGSPWTTGGLGGTISAGGRGLISLGSPATPYIEISGGSQLVTTGLNGGRAPDGMAGIGGTGGTGGGYSNGGVVSGYVGAGGEGRIELYGQRAVIRDAVITCAGGRGGDAGRGGAGALTAGSQYYFQGGGGGGGYAGGNGGSEYLNPGKSATVADFVGSGGAAVLRISAPELALSSIAVTLSGGDGGRPGAGATGGSNPAYYYYYSSGGGGGGFAGGGGGSAYSPGGAGTVSGNVGAGGEANMSVDCQNLTIDGLRLSGTGGRSQNGAQGGEGLAGGGGGGGYSGGGGGGMYMGGGIGQTSGNAGAGGNATFVAVSTAVRAVNLTIDLDGGAAGTGGAGGKGGFYGGGGGGGYGGGGGAGFYNYNTPGGAGNCAQNVGRGGLSLFRLAASETLWINTSKVSLAGGRGGNSGDAGGSAGAGGGGGGYAGSGGGGSYGAGGEGSAGQFAGDGGDAQFELYCSRGSIPDNGLSIDAKGGIRGDGLTSRGAGSGGSGKGRATSNGGTPANIPRLIPVLAGPPDGLIYNNLDPQLAWMKCLDAVIFPASSDPVRAYEVAIDNDSSFGSPEQDVAGIKPANATCKPSGLRGGGYFWHVRALFAGGKSPGWSAEGQFFKNGPPELLKPIPTIYLDEDASLPHAVNLDVYFTDDLYPGDLTYGVSYEEDPSLVHATLDGPWLDISAKSRDWHGSCNFSVRATDRGGISNVSNAFMVIVMPVNDPPRFVNLPFIEVTEDRDFRFDITPYLGDVDNALDQLVISLASPNAFVEGHIITLRYSTEVGTDWINIGLTDGQSIVSLLLEVRVAPVDDLPQARPVPDLLMNEDSSLTLDLASYARDEEDSPGMLRWRAEEVPQDLLNVSIDGNNILTVTPRPEVSGYAMFRLVVRDTGDGESSVNVSVKIFPVNDPPVIGAIPALALKVNVTHKLDIRPYVSDVDNAMSELRVTADSAYANVSGFVITLRYPDERSLDREVVRITVGDGLGTTRRELSVQLRFSPEFTGAVEVITLGARKAVSIDLTRYVYDREDAPSGLRWAVLGLDPVLLDAAIDGTGKLSVRSVKNGAAATSFVITVTDSDGNVANLTVQVSVTPLQPPASSGEGSVPVPLAVAAVAAVALIGASGLVYIRSGRRKGDHT